MLAGKSSSTWGVHATLPSPAFFPVHHSHQWLVLTVLSTLTRSTQVRASSFLSRAQQRLANVLPSNRCAEWRKWRSHTSAHIQHARNTLNWCVQAHTTQHTARSNGGLTRVQHAQVLCSSLWTHSSNRCSKVPSSTHRCSWHCVCVCVCVREASYYFGSSKRNCETERTDSCSVLRCCSCFLIRLSISSSMRSISAVCFPLIVSIRRRKLSLSADTELSSSLVCCRFASFSNL